VEFCDLNLESVDYLSLLGAPEIGDEFSVFLFVDAELGLLIVFELGMVQHLLGNSLSSEQPHSLNFKVWLLSKHGVHGESVLSEVINSLEESVEVVGGLVKNHTLTFVLLVVNEVDGVSLSVVVLEEELHALSSSVFVVDNEGLECEQVEGTGREHVQRIDILLFGLWFIASLGLFGFLNFLDFFLFGGSNWLDDLGSEVHVTESLHSFGQVNNSVNEVGSVGHCLSESTIQSSLEWQKKRDGNNNVSNGDVFSDQELFSLQVDVEKLDAFLDFLDSVIVGIAFNNCPSASGSQDCEYVRVDRSMSEVNPLVNKCGFVVSNSGQLGVWVEASNVSSNGRALEDCAFACLQARELSGGALGLVLLAFLLLGIQDHLLDGHTGEVGSNECGISEDVSNVVVIDFLCKR